jgi:hypothetical protein
VEATRYEEDSLTVFVNGELAVIDYRSPTGEVFTSSHHGPPLEPFEEVVFTVPGAAAFEFSKALVIHRREALEILASHIRDGHPVNLKPWLPPGRRPGRASTR